MVVGGDEENGVAEAISLVVLALFSLIITRIATVALTLTGLSRESARFQARSALTGAGFTTNESEAIVGHPVRRRIVMTLMLTGSIGIVTVVATLSTALIQAEGLGAYSSRGALVLLGMVGLYFLASSRLFDRLLRPVIGFVLDRVPDLEVRDYASLLQVHGDYAVMELAVRPGDWVAEKSLIQLRLPDEGIVVLGVLRDDETYVGAPEGTTVIRTGETLVVYGQRHRLKELDDRPDGPEGDRAHERASEDQAWVEATQDPYAHGPTLRERTTRRAKRTAKKAATAIPGVNVGQHGRLRVRSRARLDADEASTQGSEAPADEGADDVVGATDEHDHAEQPDHAGGGRAQVVDGP